MSDIKEKSIDDVSVTKEVETDIPPHPDAHLTEEERAKKASHHENDTSHTTNQLTGASFAVED